MKILALLAAAEEGASPSLVSLQVNLMFWTLVIFLLLFWILKKWAFPAVLGAVEAREKALADAIEHARRDRDEAAKLLNEQRASLEATRADAQRLIAEARTVGEKSRAELLEKARTEQQDMLERARREIEVERDKAIAELRREAVDLAIAGAGKVVEQNLDNEKNRKLVDAFLATLAAEGRSAKAERR